MLQGGSVVTLDQKIRPHPEVVDTGLDAGETVLLHLESKAYYSLNSTGTRIWQVVKQALTMREISQRLGAEFEVEADRADRSVLALVHDLAQHQLVQMLD
jgi:hypothetical protein